MFILAGAQLFSWYFKPCTERNGRAGCRFASLNQAEFIYLVLAVVFILGFFLDFIEICFIIIPLIMP